MSTSSTPPAESSDESLPDILADIAEYDLQENDLFTASRCSGRFTNLDDFRFDQVVLSPIFAVRSSLPMNIPVVSFRNAIESDYDFISFTPPPMSPSTGAVPKKKNGKRNRNKNLFRNSSDSSSSGTKSSSEKIEFQFPVTDTSKQKIPLKHVWTFWISVDSTWENMGNFSDLGEFSEEYHRVTAGVEERYDELAVFRRDIHPDWRSHKNKDGGHWKITLERTESNFPKLNSLWLNCVLYILNEFYESMNHYICGVILESQENHLNIYFRESDASKTESILMLKWKIKSALSFPSTATFKYESIEGMIKDAEFNEILGL